MEQALVGTRQRLAVQGVYELVLEVDDLAAAERFYVDVIGLAVVARWEPPRLATWLDIGEGGFLGLWPVETGGVNAIHNGRGGRHVHVALRVAHDSLKGLAVRIESAGFPTEWRHFNDGNVALYVTDPDGNVVEFTELVVRWDGQPESREV
ncbi:MAG TPA: VOC family protein [Thermomicrobiales bacterium]|jgi:catechol 2,3-dioxygenase-like lactoylglutathione lyase family enzyme|nr:VOC family protein [Thermomicrobiales bacterium]